MSAFNFQLAEPPSDDRRRELWLQHAAAFILFENIRNRALVKIDQNASAETRRVAEKAIDDAMYGLMMLIDGVIGGLRNSDYEVEVRVLARLKKTKNNDAPIQELDLRDSDGFCLGFHDSKEGAFGHSIIVGAP
jgi:hypothetical protein